MYRHILAAINEHSNSEAAARYAVAAAQTAGASLTLAFVAPPGLPVEVVRSAEAALERLFLEASAKKVPVESLVGTGEPVRHLKDLVRDKRVDLAFVATRREDLSRRYFTSTVARRLSLALPCSVALVRVVHPGHVFPRHLLVPLRGAMTHLEERAMLVGLLAQAFGARVTLFHAPRHLERFFRGTAEVPLPEREPGVVRKMVEFMALLARFQVDTRQRFRRGRPAVAITTEAAVSRHDLIVMGASTRGLLASLVSGNPVEEVLRETPCNLIIHLPRGGGA